jgi:hypothetical protein
MTCKRIAKIYKRYTRDRHLRNHQWYCGNDSPIQASTSSYNPIDADADPLGKTDKFASLTYFLKVGIHCKESTLSMNMAAVPFSSQ